MKYRPVTLELAKGIIVYAFKLVDRTGNGDDEFDEQFLLLKIASMLPEHEVSKAICTSSSLCAALKVRTQGAEDIFEITRKKDTYKVILG